MGGGLGESLTPALLTPDFHGALADVAVGDGQGQAGEQQAEEAGGPQLHPRHSLATMAWHQSPLAPGASRWYHEDGSLRRGCGWEGVWLLQRHPAWVSWVKSSSGGVPPHQEGTAAMEGMGLPSLSQHPQTGCRAKGTRQLDQNPGVLLELIPLGKISPANGSCTNLKSIKIGFCPSLAP